MESNRIALIDADILVYRVGFASEDVDEGIALWRLDDISNRIMEEVGAQNARFFLTSTDKSNYRFELFPEYKAHRDHKPKPRHYDALRNTLEGGKYLAEVIYGREADDALGCELTSLGDKGVLCTIDKDLDQIPGWHYNFVKNRLYNISEVEGWRSFYMQCLVGDKPTDNIDGCPKIGEVKALRMLEGCENEKEMFETVLKAYQNAFSNPEEAVERLWLAGSLLWVQRENGKMWHRHSGEVVSKMHLKTCLLNEESSTSTSLTNSNTSSPLQTTSTLQTTL